VCKLLKIYGNAEINDVVCGDLELSNMPHKKFDEGKEIGKTQDENPKDKSFGIMLQGSKMLELRTWGREIIHKG